MPANPVNTIVEITNEQFDRARLLMIRIEQLNDQVLFGHEHGIAINRNSAKRERARLIKERQALLAVSGEQYEALKLVAALFGKRWKTELRAMWENCAYGRYVSTRDNAHLLQQVRNTRGLVWLENFRLPGR